MQLTPMDFSGIIEQSPKKPGNAANGAPAAAALGSLDNGGSSKLLPSKPQTSEEKGSGAPTAEESSVKVVVKSKQCHWDFLLKEMMWLSTDFKTERGRHRMSSRKVATAARMYVENKEKRDKKKAEKDIIRLKSCARKISKEVMGYWAKIERVLGYSQKVKLEQGTRRDMDKHLVYLVQQTERYGQSLAQGMIAQQEHESLIETDLNPYRRSTKKVDYKR